MLAPLTNADLESKIKAVLPNARIMFGDSSHLAVKEDWITGDLYNYFERWLDAMRVDGWDTHFDCDDFATLFRMVAQGSLNSSKQSHALKGQALAIGEMWYKNDRGGHAICVTICEEGVVKFLEPQSGEMVCLDTSELQSCWHVRF